MTKQPIIFWGATGQAKVLRDCLLGSGLELAAVFDNNPDLVPPFADVPLHLGWDGFLAWHASRPRGEVLRFLVAIGGDRGRIRIDMQERLEQAGLMPALAIHRNAFVAPNAFLAPGCQVLAQAAVCVDAVLERGCIVNTAASVDHECRLAEGVHIAPGARLAGLVEVGRYSMVCTGATVLPRVRIGENSIVGAGAVVLRDVPDNVVVAGNPARIIKEREPI